MNSFNGGNGFDDLLEYFEHMYDMFVEAGFDFSQCYLAISKRFKDEMKKDPNAPEGFDMETITRAIREVIYDHKNKTENDKIDEVVEIPRNTTSEEIALENSKIELKDEVRQDLRNELWDEVERNAKLDAERYWRSELRSVVEQKLRNEITGELERSIRIKVERELRNELKDESHDKDKNELRDKLKDEVRQDLRNELWDEVEYELRDKLRNEVERKLRNELHDEIKAGLENEMRNEVKIELKKKLYDEAKNELKEEMRGKVENELKHTLRKELGDKVYNKVREELHDKFINEMKKEDIRNEVKGELLYDGIINSVLNSAIEHDYPEIVKLLINDYYVDLETEDESGMTLLMKAAKSKRYNIVRMILNKISDSNVDSDDSNED